MRALLIAGIVCNIGVVVLNLVIFGVYGLVPIHLFNAVMALLLVHALIRKQESQ